MSARIKTRRWTKNVLAFMLAVARTNVKTFFFNWDSLHATLNSHYKAWSYKKKEHKKIKAYRKSV